MKIALDITVLDALLKHATSAARRVGHIGHSVVGPLAGDIDAIVHELSELLGHALQVPKPVLGELLAHASSAARIVGHLDDRERSPAVEQLSDHVDALVHGLGELVGGHRLTDEPVQAEQETNAVDELRQLIERADALASTTDEQFSRIVVLTEGDDRRGFKRLAHLVELTAMAVTAASDASAKLIAAVERALPSERT